MSGSENGEFNIWGQESLSTSYFSGLMGNSEHSVWVKLRDGYFRERFVGNYFCNEATATDTLVISHEHIMAEKNKKVEFCLSTDLQFGFLTSINCTTGAKNCWYF